MANRSVTSHRLPAEGARDTASGRGGKTCAIVPVSDEILDWLVSKKYLAARERTKTTAIKQAIESFLSDSVSKAIGQDRLKRMQ
jgi:hypothetical protein